MVSKKCRLDFQFLNADIETGVITVFYPLSDKFELTNPTKTHCKLIVQLVMGIKK